MESTDESDFEGFNSTEIAETEELLQQKLKEIEDLEQNDCLSEMEEDSDIELEDSLEESEESSGSSSENEETFIEPVWSKKYVSFTVPTCTGEEGTNFPEDFDAETATPWEFASLFITFDLVETLVKNTNSYADKNILEKNLDRDKVWGKETDVREMKTYLGISILFGINRFPRYRDYWDNSPFLGNQGVKNAMSRERYEQLGRFFHVSDTAEEFPRGHPRHDKLGKVRPILEHCARLFPKYKHPSKHMSIDEGMIKFKGRSVFVQFMKDKPVKRGLKVFLRNDSDTGYLHQFEVYLGKNGTISTSGQGVYFDVINRLTRTVRNKNYRIWFDNLYTSVPLAKFLLKHGILSCGTIRANRKHLPKEFKEIPKKKPRGWSSVYQDKKEPNLTCCIWQDTKIVRFLSTVSKPTLFPKCVRRSGRTYLSVEQPHAAFCYNKHMAGTDKFDQKRGTYQVGRAAKKLHKYLFWFLINSCLVNAWILFDMSSKIKRSKRYKQFDFRHDIVKHLLLNNGQRKRAPINVAISHEVIVDHAHVKMDATGPRQCHLHKKYFAKTYRTIRGCKGCNQHFCFECHARFHHWT